MAQLTKFSKAVHDAFTEDHGFVLVKSEVDLSEFVRNGKRIMIDSNRETIQIEDREVESGQGALELIEHIGRNGKQDGYDKEERQLNKSTPATHLSSLENVIVTEDYDYPTVPTLGENLSDENSVSIVTSIDNFVQDQEDNNESFDQNQYDESTDVQQSANSQIIEKELTKADRKIDKMVNQFLDKLILQERAEHEELRWKVNRYYMERSELARKMDEMTLTEEETQVYKAKLDITSKLYNDATQDEINKWDRLTVILEKKFKFVEELKEDIKNELMRELSEFVSTKLAIRSDKNVNRMQRVRDFFHNFLVKLNIILHNPAARFSTKILSRKSDGDALEKRVKDRFNEISQLTKAGMELTSFQRNEIKRLIEANIAMAREVVSKGEDNLLSTKQREADFERERAYVKCLRKQLSLALHQRLFDLEAGAENVKGVKREKLKNAIREMDEGFFSIVQSTDLGFIYIMKDLDTICDLEIKSYADRMYDLKIYTDKLIENIDSFRKNHSKLDNMETVRFTLVGLTGGDPIFDGIEADLKRAMFQYVEEQTSLKIFPEMFKEGDECYKATDYLKQRKQLDRLTGVQTNPIPCAEYDDGEKFTASSFAKNRNTIHAIKDKNIKILDDKIGRIQSQLRMMDDEIKEKSSRIVGDALKEAIDIINKIPEEVGQNRSGKTHQNLLRAAQNYSKIEKAESRDGSTNSIENIGAPEEMQRRKLLLRATQSYSCPQRCS